MESYPQEELYEETPVRESVPIQARLQRMAGLLAPEQRLMLSIFLFMDVCILCFACLFLFQKIALPF